MGFYSDKNQSGFTLLEVIMTITILLTLTIAATTAIRNSIDIRQGLSSQVTISHSINAVMQRVVADLEEVFIISTKRTEYNPAFRKTKTIFRLESNGTLSMTTMSKRPTKANAPESDQTYVVYELKESSEQSGRYELYRGETKVIPQNFREKIPMVLLSENVKVFEVEVYTGSKWSADRWDTTKNEHRNMLPRMVKVHIEMFEIDEEAGPLDVGVEDMPTSGLTSVVYLPKSWGLKEYKPGSPGEILKWL